MPVEGTNFRSLTPQQKLVKLLVRLGDQAIHEGANREETLATIERATSIAERLSIEAAEEVLAEENE